jgi:REase_DpnII-MboI
VTLSANSAGWFSTSSACARSTNLLWAVLAPAFPDLEDEENLPSIGHKKPRADLGIPSLQTIIEVKFLRASGQRPCAQIIEEIAADSSLYLSKPSAYDNIVAFVWDDCASRTENRYRSAQRNFGRDRVISALYHAPRLRSNVYSLAIEGS